MDEADFAALNEHLREVRPIFDDFCARHGFEHVPRQALGRYPRIRISRPGAPWDRATTMRLWFDLSMELDEHGKRFEHFKRDLPYHLGAGANVDVWEHSSRGVRYGLAFPCFDRKPFDQVVAVLQHELELHLPVLERWDLQYLKDNGDEIRLGS